MAHGPRGRDLTISSSDGFQPSVEVRLSAFQRAGQSISVTANWLADRIEDTGGWLANLVRYGPARVARILTTLTVAIVAMLDFVYSTLRILRRDRVRTRPFLAERARQGRIRLMQIVLSLADLIGAPEIFALMWRAVTHVSPLTGAEIEAAATVLGPNAVRYQDIRIAQGGVLKWVFARNGQRAFATFHTINLPQQGRHQRSNTDIVVHEIIHVYQYERAGSRYFAEALEGQREEGYNYGGPEGLKAALRQGKQLRNFNREQQAQIAQDYYAALRLHTDLTAYVPFIRQLREGAL